MAKFTRTAYAAGSLRELAQRIAGHAQLTDTDALVAAYDDIGHRKTRHLSKRVRITILVEPEAPPPKRAKGPRRPVPVQQVLDLSNTTPVDIQTYLENKGPMLHHLQQSLAGGSTP